MTCGSHMVMRLVVAGVLIFSSVALSAADEKDVLNRLQEIGAKVTTENENIAVSAGNCSKWTDDDFKALGSLTKVTKLVLGGGYKESSLTLLAGLSNLESFTTNSLSDDNVKVLLQFPKLKQIVFGHTGFPGLGLASLADLKQLESVTIRGSAVAGSRAGDEAFECLSKIKSLKQIRIYHLSNTNEGVRRLRDLPYLESLTLGQRGGHVSPACPNDETIAALCEIRSLKTLTLSESRLSHDSVAQLKQLPQLQPTFA